MATMYDKTEFFKTYFQNAGEKDLIVTSLKNKFNQFSDTLSILDLGCHDGALINRILDCYQDDIRARVNLTGVDPSAVAINEFMQNNYKKEWMIQGYACTAEAYFNDHADVYDWVLASQCLYWSTNLPEIVNRINKAGVSGLIVFRGKKGIYEVQSKFRKLLGNKAEKLYTADDIEAVLRLNNINYRREDHTTMIKLPDPASQEMRWLIAFFLQTEDCELADDDFDEVINAINVSDNQMRHDVSLFWLGQGIQ